MAVKFLELFVGNAAVGEYGLYFILVQNERFRLFLVFLRHFRKAVVDILDKLDTAVLAERFLDQRLKGFLLVACGERQRTAEKLADKAVVQFLGIL